MPMVNLILPGFSEQELNEIWKEIPGYEGLYSVSNQGRVKRLLSRTSGKAGKLLKPQLNGKGYHHVILYKNRTKWCVRVHILVMLTFVGQCPDGMEINHIKGIKTDNRLSQLEYVTHLQNVKHAFDILNRKRSAPKGEQSGSAKLTEANVRVIRTEFASGGISKSALARRYGVNQKTIRNIINRVKWKHV